MHDIGHLEVLIRNRYDAALTATFPDWSSSRSKLWIQQLGIQSTREKQRYSNRESRKHLDEAARRAPRCTHGHIVANLSFGFWANLTRSERDATFWTPMLNRVYPGWTRGSIHDRMTKLNGFRNRLAHWEPMFSRTTGFARHLGYVDELFAAVDPDVSAWVDEHSTVVELLSAMPVPVLQGLHGTYLRTKLD